MPKTSDELKRIREMLGAPVSDWQPPVGPSAKTLEALRQPGGLEIDKSELRELGGPGGLLSYNGAQIVLYIKNTRVHRTVLENSPDESPKFHLVDCQTLQEMKNIGRIDRYVTTQQTDGLFRVEPQNEHWGHENEEFDTRLYPCKHCLRYLNYGNCKSFMVSIDRVREDFVLEDFFREYATFFNNLPKYSDITAPPGGYVRDWNRISKRYRASKNWVCEECKVDLSGHRELLHTHHIDGVTTNNSDANFQALCILCHGEKPLHNLPVQSHERELILSMRS